LGHLLRLAVVFALLFAGLWGVHTAVLLQTAKRYWAEEANRRLIVMTHTLEADILADGSLDYTPQFLDRFDFVIASIHSRFDMDERTMTARVLTAMDDRHTAIIGRNIQYFRATIDITRSCSPGAARKRASPSNVSPPTDNLTRGVCFTFFTHWRFTLPVGR